MYSVLSFLMTLIPKAHAFLEQIGTAGPGVGGMWSQICGSLFCTFGGSSGSQTVYALARKVTNFTSMIIGGVAVAIVVYAGIRMIAAQGKDDQVAEARKMIIYALVGLGLAIIAPVIVSFVIRFIQSATGQGILVIGG